MVNRLLLAIAALIVTIGVAAYGDAHKLAGVKQGLTAVSMEVTGAIGLPVPAKRGAAVDVARRRGQFLVRAAINGSSVPMMVDTGASSVVLTYEAAKEAGLPVELLDYDVDLETAAKRIKGARVTLDQLAIGKLIEHSVPAIVVAEGGLKSNLLGMSFLDRLESWEVRGDRLVLRGFP